MRNADSDAATIGRHIVDAIGNSNANGVGGEVMIVDVQGRCSPPAAGVFEVPHKLTLLGVNADDGLAVAMEAVAQIADIEELPIAFRTGIGRDLFTVDP